MDVRRLLISLAFVAAGLASGCSDPKAVVVETTLPAFARDHAAAVGALKGEDQNLFHRFLAEYERVTVDPHAGVRGAEMPRHFEGRTLGDVLKAAQAYFAAKQSALNAQADTRYSGIRERAEYSGAPPGEHWDAPTSATGAAQAIELEVLRGGPHGEPRIFESEAERVGLAKGQTPRYMNAQFRYYLADIAVAPASPGGCAHATLAVKLAVENLRGAPVSAIHGRFTFLQTSGDGGAAVPVGAVYGGDIIGPFSDREGGVSYVTAYVERSTEIADAAAWAKITAVAPSRRKVYFSPDVFYFPDGDQYASGFGRSPAVRQPQGCA